MSLSATVSCGGLVGSKVDQNFEDAATSTFEDAATSMLDSNTSHPDVDASPPFPQQQKIVFEIAYHNFAWQPKINGYFITSEGNVYRYDYFDSAAPDAGPPHLSYDTEKTEQQLTSKHGSSPQLVGKVEPATLRQKFALVNDTLQGGQIWQRYMSDYGIIAFLAYNFSVETNLYYPVVLGFGGDFIMKNISPEAIELVRWLSSLTGDWQLLNEYKILRYCDKDPCPGSSPCDPGSVPGAEADAQCATFCTSPEFCEYVLSCSTCTANGLGCLIDQSARAYCLKTKYYGCEGTLSCECGGKYLCAGGKSYCHGNAQQGFTCSKP